jgi:uncharacterized membrane protein
MRGETTAIRAHRRNLGPPTTVSVTARLSARTAERLEGLARGLARRAHVAIVAAAGLYAVAGAAPIFPGFGSTALAASLRAACSLTCARTPSHLLAPWGLPSAICARCLALYGAFALAGALAGAAGRSWRSWRSLRIGGKIAALLALPMAIDALTQAAGMRESTTALRILTGALAGAAAALAILPVLRDAARRL